MMRISRVGSIMSANGPKVGVRRRRGIERLGGLLRVDLRAPAGDLEGELRARCAPIIGGF